MDTDDVLDRMAEVVKSSVPDLADHIELSVVTEPVHLDSLLHDLELAEAVCFDLETQGDESNLWWWHPSARVVTAAFTVLPHIRKPSNPSPAGSLESCHHVGVVVNHPDVKGVGHEGLRAIAEMIEQHEVQVVGHNVKYDVVWLEAVTGVDLSHLIAGDSLLTSRLLDETASGKLKERATEDLGVRSWSETVNLKRPDANPLGDLLGYNVLDTAITWALWIEHEQRMLNAVESSKDADEVDPDLLAHACAHNLEQILLLPAWRSLSRVQQRGMLLDVDKVRTALEKDEGEIERLRETLWQRAPEHLREQFNKASISWGPTAKWARALLADTLPVREWTEGGKARVPQPSWSADVLRELAEEGYEIAELFHELRAAEGRVTKFYRPWLARIDEQGRLHPSFTFVRTGRTSCSEPNLQQVHRDLKPCFTAPPGWWFVEVDYSQIELRVGAMLSGDERMIEAFNNGEDLHTLMASQVYSVSPEEVTTEQRQFAKVANFGFLYGMGANKMAIGAIKQGLDMDVEEAYRLRETFFATWPQVGEWHERCQQMAQTYHMSISPIGRVRRLPEINSGNPMEVSEAFRKAINSPVQSLASDITLAALTKIDHTLPADRVRVVGFVHDAILLEVRADAHIAETLREVGRVMADPELLTHLGFIATVPLVAEATFGSRWKGEDCEGAVITPAQAS